jgi:hypothetical protein
MASFWDIGPKGTIEAEDHHIVCPTRLVMRCVSVFVALLSHILYSIDEFGAINESALLYQAFGSECERRVR